MSDWRLAKALDTLRAEVNTAHPNRPTDADGTIGDPAHAARKSDHNPNPPHAGVVTAWDITTADFTNALAEQLRLLGKAGDGRVKYVIYRRRIATDRDRWAWRPYKGSDPHIGHIHLSLSDDPAQYDRTDPWLTKPAEKGDGDMTAAEHKLLLETRKIAEANGKLLGQILDRLEKLEAPK